MTALEAHENVIQNTGHLKHSRVAILGSAPGKHFIPPADYIASINGSHAAFGVSHVNILFLNSSSLWSRKTPVQVAVQDALSSVTCDILFYIDAARFGPAPDMGQFRTLSFSNEQRRDLLTWATGVDYSDVAGGDAVPSTGITAALVLRKLGSTPILSGFSLDGGHALTDGARRWHTRQDEKYMHLFAEAAHG